MKIKTLKQLELNSQVLLPSIQMNMLKGGDDGIDALTNTGTCTSLTFGGGA